MLEINGFLIQDDIQDIVTELRTQLSLNGIDRFKDIKKSGNNLICTCPFHNDGQERKPSFGILLKDKRGQKAGTGHCFTCGWAGSLQEMISNCFGKDDWGKFGSQWLVKNFLSVAIERRPEIDLGFDDKILKTEHFVSKEELDSYREYHTYMWVRKLTPEIVDIFDVGYDKEANCITMPNYDENGNCLFVARRSVQTKYFNYPSDVAKPLYGLWEMKKVLGEIPNTIYITESMLDCMSLWRVGKYALALNGLGSSSQVAKLRSLPTRTYILATDCDKAGLQARRKLADALYNKVVMQVFFPEGRKDANDCTDEELLNLEEVFI